MGNERFIDWQLGTQAAFDKVVPLGLPPAAWMCRRADLTPLSEWARGVAPPGQRTRVDEGQSAAARFARLSNTEKLGVAMRSAARTLGPELGGKLQDLTSPTNLAIMAGALAIWVGAQATPIGWIVDIGMVGLGVVAVGAEAINVMREVHAFAIGVIRAKSEIDLMEAGRHLAKAIAIVGVDVVVAILLKKAIVKVRQPARAGGGGADEAKLFGKYDPQDAVKSLPSESPVARRSPGATLDPSNRAKGDTGLSFGRKLDFLFNKGIDQSNAYNAARAAGNAERIGIADTVANRAEVTRLFNQAYRDPTTIVGPGKIPGSNLREFFLPGVTGTGSKIQFVEKSGQVITIIAK